jgi:transposase
MRSRKAATSAHGSSSCRSSYDRRPHYILGSISKRGNHYLRSLFVQAAWVALVKIGPKHWDRYGLKSWIEAARKRLHHNVLAIALANKLARIAWGGSSQGAHTFEWRTSASAGRDEGTAAKYEQRNSAKPGAYR